VRREAVDRYLWKSVRKILSRLFAGPGGPRCRVFPPPPFTPCSSGWRGRPQADAVAATVSSELLKEGGIEATALLTHQQWDAPNGWALCNGLRSRACAPTRMRPWPSASLPLDGLRQPGVRRAGKLVEKYDVGHRSSGGGGISHAGWVRLDQRRDAPAHGGLTRPTRTTRRALNAPSWRRTDTHQCSLLAVLRGSGTDAGDARATSISMRPPAIDIILGHGAPHQLHALAPLVPRQYRVRGDGRGGLATSRG